MKRFNDVSKNVDFRNISRSLLECISRVGNTFISNFAVPESVVLSFSIQSLKKTRTSTRARGNNSNNKLLTQKFERNHLCYLHCCIYCIYHVFILFVTYCVMYEVFTDSESIDSDKRQRISSLNLKGFSLWTFKLYQCLWYTYDYSMT